MGRCPHRIPAIWPYNPATLKFLAEADFDAPDGIVQAAFGSTGQRCTATSRVIVEEPVYDQFMEGLIDRPSKLKIGDGLDPDVDLAPLARLSHFEPLIK